MLPAENRLDRSFATDARFRDLKGRGLVNLNRLTYRNSVFFFALIAIAALFGFWPGYLSQISGHDVIVHVHGDLLTLLTFPPLARAFPVRVSG